MPCFDCRKLHPSPVFPTSLPCSTDALIVLKVLVHHGVPLEQAATKLPEMQAAMVAYFEANKQVLGVGEHGGLLTFRQN